MLVYDSFKLSHSGITKFTTFENYIRKVHSNSLSNLLQNRNITNQENIAISDKYNFRNLNPIQSRKIKQYCNKLIYYSATRKFTNSKQKVFYFKVAFLTLTAPDLTTPKQFLKALDSFLDYLRRTANCVYVYKKELGEKNGKLHVHILINNFIPYYIVSWKWKRLLMFQGVQWPVNTKGKETNSHYRIELPKSKKQVGAYVAKYLSKAYELPKEYGYIWGKSELLDNCKEAILMEGDVNSDELSNLYHNFRKFESNYVCHIICDLLRVESYAPTIQAIFEKLYIEFCQIITLPQRFTCV